MQPWRNATGTPDRSAKDEFKIAKFRQSIFESRLSQFRRKREMMQASVRGARRLVPCGSLARSRGLSVGNFAT